jgi:hypothetical protein
VTAVVGVTACQPAGTGTVQVSQKRALGRSLGREGATKEQPRIGDLARERFAVAFREERVPATVHHQRRNREFGQPLTPAWPALEPGEQ